MRLKQIIEENVKYDSKNAKLKSKAREFKARLALLK